MGATTTATERFGSRHAARGRARLRPLAALAALCGVTLTGACDDVTPYAPEGEVSLRPGGGLRYDTNHVGSHHFSELDLSKSSVWLAPWRLCVRIWWEDGMLWCETGDGKVYALLHFLGSTWTADVDGEPVKLRLADLKYIEERDHWLARFEDLDGNPTCDPDENGERWALLYGNVHFDGATASFSHDEDTLHIACLSGILGDAGQRYGWTPDALDGDLEAMDAAIRAAAFDPCGAGTPMASALGGFAAADHHGLNAFGPGASKLSEGVYDAQGMVCSGTQSRQGPIPNEPSCPGGVTIPVCDEASLATLFASDARLIWTKPIE